jgi:hypothetical protein
MTPVTPLKTMNISFAVSDITVGQELSRGGFHPAVDPTLVTSDVAPVFDLSQDTCQ